MSRKNKLEIKNKTRLQESPLYTKSLRKNTTKSLTITSGFVSKSTLLPKIIKFINKYLYKLPVFGIGAVLDRYTNNFTIYSSSEDKKRYLEYEESAIFANFGCGSFSHNKWQNFDYPGLSKYYKAILGKPYRDYIPIDLTRENLEIPLNDNSVDLIYLSHVFEHLGEGPGIKLFEEFHRILKTNGIVRIAIPFVDRMIFNSSILNKQENIPEIEKVASTTSSVTEAFADAHNLDSHEILKIARESNFDVKEIETQLKKKFTNLLEFDPSNPGRHIVYWNELKLIELVKKTGFKKIYPIEGTYICKTFENIVLFDTEPHLSIYFEIVK